MKARILFAAVLTFAAVVADAAPTTLRGTVVTSDGATRYPDVEVTVTVKGQTVYTDAEGEFFIRDLQPGTYDVRVKTSRSETLHRITALPQPVTVVTLAVK
ncbi:MAG TPA: carboxypeptidase regulatory-like domain-containing protein [Thermoanaerobaculia bacterium]|jgi:hypothetical protein|nr:carboxypeptidase regulatory-like domain-containing protein [Thermoanaerobaculia bacterium]